MGLIQLTDNDLDHLDQYNLYAVTPKGVHIAVSACEAACKVDSDALVSVLEICRRSQLGYPTRAEFPLYGSKKPETVPALVPLTDADWGRLETYELYVVTEDGSRKSVNAEDVSRQVTCRELMVVDGDGDDRVGYYAYGERR